jgi:hypothetical protein
VQQLTCQVLGLLQETNRPCSNSDTHHSAIVTDISVAFVAVGRFSVVSSSHSSASREMQMYADSTACSLQCRQLLSGECMLGLVGWFILSAKHLLCGKPVGHCSLVRFGYLIHRQVASLQHAFRFCWQQWFASLLANSGRCLLPGQQFGE